MKYMLLMMAPTGGWAKFGTLPPEDIRAHISFMKKLNADLTSAGELVDAQGLAFPSQAKVVTAKASGGPAVSDGPFPESKEFLAGYWIVDVPDEARAIALAAHISTAPGAGGAPMRFPVEVRQVMAWRGRPKLEALYQRYQDRPSMQATQINVLPPLRPNYIFQRTPL